ncbi:hypothetical protein D3C80_2206220 [compost metagenome]
MPLLEDFTCPATGFHLLTEGGRKLPQRVKAFVDFAVHYFNNLQTPARHLLMGQSPR